MQADLLEKILELPIKSDVLTQPFLDFLAQKYPLSHNGFHGIDHWLRVLINGRHLAKQTGADLKVVEYFALIHDVMRHDEDRDINHGNRSADLVLALDGDWLHLSSDQLGQLEEACRYHSMGRLTRDVTIQSCRDADRLDLGRVGIRPNSTYLGTRIARDPEFLEAAYQRSKQRFVDYSFRR